MNRQPDGFGRVTTAVRVSWGAMLLCAPEVILAGLGHRPQRSAVVILRVLGVRHLAQAAITMAMPTSAVIRAGAAADALHGASAAICAVAAPRWRRAAAADTAVALALSVADRSTARQHSDRRAARKPRGAQSGPRATD